LLIPKGPDQAPVSEGLRGALKTRGGMRKKPTSRSRTRGVRKRSLSVSAPVKRREEGQKKNLDYIKTTSVNNKNMKSQKEHQKIKPRQTPGGEYVNIAGRAARQTVEGGAERKNIGRKWKIRGKKGSGGGVCGSLRKLKGTKKGRQNRGKERTNTKGVLIVWLTRKTLAIWGRGRRKRHLRGQTHEV